MDPTLKMYLQYFTLDLIVKKNATILLWPINDKNNLFYIYFLDLGVQTKTGSDPSKKSELDMQATKYIVICHMISIVIK